jgi:hypothetical protein
LRRDAKRNFDRTSKIPKELAQREAMLSAEGYEKWVRISILDVVMIVGCSQRAEQLSSVCSSIEGMDYIKKVIPVDIIVITAIESNADTLTIPNLLMTFFLTIMSAVLLQTE